MTERFILVDARNGAQRDIVGRILAPKQSVGDFSLGDFAEDLRAGFCLLNFRFARYCGKDC